MALIKCPECGKSFSDKAAACPECGCPADYAVNEAEKKKEEERVVLASHISPLEVYKPLLEQEWENYLVYYETGQQVIAEALAAAERVVDKQIEETENAIQLLSEKRASLGLFAFSEKKALDEQISEQQRLLNDKKKNRFCEVDNLQLTFEVGEMDGEEFLQYAEHLETLIRLRNEYAEASQRMMFSPDSAGIWAFTEEYENVDITSDELVTKHDFETGFRERYIGALLESCLKELGKINTNDFSRLSGFSKKEIIDSCVYGSAEHQTDPDTGEDILVYKNYELDRLKRRMEVERAVIKGSSGSSGYIPDFSGLYQGQAKSASVVGRAALGAVIAGPVGAIVGALSAADKNNRNRR